MTRFLLILFSALSLAACATTPPPTAPMAAVTQGGAVAFGTLAPFGSWEFEVAPAATRLASLLRRAAARVDSGRLDLDGAARIQALGAAARGHLEAARRGSAAVPTVLQRQHLVDAARLLDQINDILEH